VRTSKRHQLKQDRFRETTKSLLAEAIEHRQSIVRTAIGAGVILAVILVSWWIRESRNGKASVALGKAIESYSAPLRPAGTPPDPEALSFANEAERASAAHALFEQVANQYGLTRSGQAARYLAALTAIDMGDPKGGEAELKQVADFRNRELASQAKLTLANFYRNTGRQPEALKLYQELADHPTALVAKPTVEIQMAALYQSMNQPAEATKIYSQLLKEDPNGAAAEIAGEQLRKQVGAGGR
jgi:tetratricopeptide (TPR) repeat protein